MSKKQVPNGSFHGESLRIEDLPVELRPEHLHRAQRKIYEHRARIRVAVCGRRFGKTYLGMLEALHACVRARTRVVWWVSAAKTQAKRVWRLLRRPLARGGQLAPGRGEQNRLAFANHSTLEFVTAGSGDGLRGEGLDWLVVDEAADVPEEVWSSVLRPSLVDKKGRALIIGTPRGRGNWLHRLWMQGRNTAGSEHIKSFRFRTLDNPRIEKEELESARHLMSELEFRQEFEAEFIEGSGRVFGDVRVLATSALRERGAPGARYVTGIDLARKKDYTVLLSLRVPGPADGGAVQPPVRMEGFRRMRDRPWDEQEAVIRHHLRAFPGSCVVDATGMGDPMYERIRAFCPPTMAYKFTAARKENLVRGLLLAFDLKRIALAPSEALLEELEAFEYEEERDGRRRRHFPRFGAPPGSHDDAVIALGLAWWGLCVKHGLPSVDEAGTGAPLRLFKDGFFAR